MDDLSSLCCICLKNSDRCSSLDTADSSNVKLLKKLTFCVPNETWKSHYQICDLCTGQLDIVYQFVKNCVESENFRKNDLNKNETFICDDCGKSFRQKKYLSQHITKLHIKKRRKSEIEEEIKCEKNEAKLPDKSEEQEASIISNVKDEFSNDDVAENKENSEILLEERNSNVNFECKSEILVKSDLSDYEDNLMGILSDEGRNDTTSSEKSEIDDDIDKTRGKSVKKKRTRHRETQTCIYCKETFKKRSDWTAHMRLQHSFEKPYRCSQCDAKYMNRYSLLIHSRKHTNEKPFVCDTCGKSFVSSADLNHHRKIHNKHRAYPCPVCDRSFKTHSNLRTHRLQMHLDPAEWKFACHLCEKKFPIRGNLMKHLKRHAGIKDFNCHICDKKFINKAEVTLHLNTHTNQRQFKCSICGKDYKNREGLRRHMKVVHDLGNWKAPKSEKKYLCPMCPKIFAFGNKLQRHIFTHTGEKPFKCDYCQKRFIDNYGRKVHCKKDHNLEFVE